MMIALNEFSILHEINFDYRMISSVVLLQNQKSQEFVLYSFCPCVTAH